MTIILEPKYNIGDIVIAKIDPESKLMIIGYNIVSVDENGECKDLIYQCADKSNDTANFRGYELELIEAKCI